jgi:hypothetical protein
MNSLFAATMRAKSRLFLRGGLFVAVLSVAAGSRADDYAAMAQAVASPLVEALDEAENAYADAAVMLRIAAARQQLMSSSADSPELADARRSILIPLDACHRSMLEIHRLNGKMPDFDAIARRALAATPALVRKDPETGGLTPEDDDAVDKLARTLIVEGTKLIVDAWNESTERDNYVANYRRAREQSLTLAEIAARRCTGRAPVVYGVGLRVRSTGDALTIREVVPGGPAATAGLRKGDQLIAVDGQPVAKVEAGKTTINQNIYLSLRGPRDSNVAVTYARDGRNTTVELQRNFVNRETLLDIDFDGSWNATFPDDRLALRNSSGAELTHCTLLVEILGAQGDSDKLVHERHLHYVERWPANQWRYARYRSSVAKGVATDESIDRTQRLNIELYSDQFRDTIAYQYAGTAAFESDVNRYVDQITRDQRFSLTFTGENLLSHAGVGLRHDGKFGFVPDPTVTVTLVQGNTSVTNTWPSTGKTWKAGFWSDKSLHDSSFNGLNPERVDVVLQYPGATKPSKYSWKLSDR